MSDKPEIKEVFQVGNPLPDRNGWSVEGLGMYVVAPSLTEARVLKSVLNTTYHIGYLNALLTKDE